MLLYLRSHLTYANSWQPSLRLSRSGAFRMAWRPARSTAERSKTTRSSKDIRNGEIRSKDVRDRSLLAKDFKQGELPSGAAGPRGPAGAQGQQGILGPTFAAFKDDSDPASTPDSLATGSAGSVTLNTPRQAES